MVDPKIVELSVFAVVSSDVNNGDSVESIVVGRADVLCVVTMEVSVVSRVDVYPVHQISSYSELVKSTTGLSDKVPAFKSTQVEYREWQVSITVDHCDLRNGLNYLLHLLNCKYFQLGVTRHN